MTCSKIPRIPPPPWVNVVPRAEKLCQAVVARNEQAHLQPTLNKGARGASFTTFVTDWRMLESSLIYMLVIYILLVEGYLRCKTIFFSSSSPWYVINEFFIWRKNNVSFSRYLDFLCFCEIHRFQNLWQHHRHCYIMEVTLMLISFESSYYQNEIWSNTSLLYDKHF